MSRLLDSPIEFLKGVGPQRGVLLRKELNVNTFGDLLQYYPFRYVDRSVIQRIRDINPHTQFIQLKGKVSGMRVIGEKQAKRLVATFRDDSGEIELVWFKSIDWAMRMLNTQAVYLLFGKPAAFNGTYNIVHPEMELFGEQVDAQTAKGLQPVYSTTEKAKKRNIDSRAIARLTQTLFESLKEYELPDFLPQALKQQYKLCSRYEALMNIHYPKNEKQLHEATRRLKFEELFLIQLQMLKLKANRGQSSKGYLFEKIDRQFDTFYKERMPFELTGAQKRVLREIRKDTLTGRQMNRLLQGDVGSGKTIVALLSMLIAAGNGYQSCLMAPKEILAQQHFIG